MNSPHAISKSLKGACQLLDAQEDRQLLKEVELVCEQFVNPHYGIAVLAPFNFGKSTLINALVGREIMPTKMVRTTGTVISVRYGKKLKTRITLESGEILESSDTEILKEFAVLSRRGKRREDVAYVQVFYPHRLLENGVELFDLPGTNDREEQDTLVRDKLLQVDLVLQILNAGQPFTLGEQETLRHWLINRGIKTVMFVLNKVNQIDSRKNRNEVLSEASLIANQFVRQLETNLPQGFNKIYRVDALPAIKAKQKRKKREIRASGIVTFEAALHTIISFQKGKVNQTRLLRVIAIASRVKFILQKKADQLNEQIKNDENIRSMLIDKGKQRESYLREEFKKRVETYQNWLSLDLLLGRYQTEAAQALEAGQFHDWLDSTFQSAIRSYTQSIQKWANQSCDEFKKAQSAVITIALPSNPSVSLPQHQNRNAWQWTTDVFNSGANRKRLDKEYERKKWDAYKSAVYSYLSDFSKNSLTTLKQYQKVVESLIVFPIPPESHLTIQKRHSLNDINSSLKNLYYIESLQSRITTSNVSGFQTLKFRLLYLKNWLSCFFRY